MNATNASLSLEDTTNSSWIEEEAEEEEFSGSSSSTINQLITFYGEGILLTAVSTFGLIGNLMSIVVLTRSINSRGCHDNR